MAVSPTVFRSFSIRIAIAALLASAGLAATAGTAAAQCATPDDESPLATVEAVASEGVESAAVVGQPAELYVRLRASLDDDFDPPVTWTARLRGSDRTITKRVERGIKSPEGVAITFDAPGTWEVRASFQYPRCPPGYSGEPDPASETATYETPPAVVEVSEAESVKVRANLYVPSRKRGFPDDGRTPTRLQYTYPVFEASIDCGSPSTAKAARLSWRVYIANGNKRPSGKGKPTVSWNSRPSGCAEPADDARADGDLGPDRRGACSVRGMPCGVLFGSSGFAYVNAYTTSRVLVELRQGNNMVAAYRFKYRAYRNIPNPAKRADGPYTFVSVANDGRCESMPAGKCSSYKTRKIN